jgi:hypothetical protein
LGLFLLISSCISDFKCHSSYFTLCFCVDFSGKKQSDTNKSDQYSAEQQQELLSPTSTNKKEYSHSEVLAVLVNLHSAQTQ